MTPRMVPCYMAAIASAKIGTGFFFLINTWIIIAVSHRGASGAIALGITVVPGLLLSPVIGLMVDRGVAARLAVRADFLRGLVLIVYAVIFAAGYATEAVGYLVSFLIALGNEVQTLSWRAALVRIARPDQVLRLNALTVVGGQTGQILGTALSGLLLAVLGGALTILLAGTTYLAAACFGAVIDRVYRGVERSTIGTGARRTFYGEWKEGVSYLSQKPEICFFYGVILLNMTVIFGINSMLALFVRDDLKLGAEAFGIIDAGYALGAILSGLLIVRVSDRVGTRVVLVSGFLLMATSLAGLSQAHGLVGATIAYVGLGISFQTSAIALSLAQRATGPAFQGRVSASFTLLNALAGLIVYGLVAASTAHHLFRAIYLGQALLMLILVPLALLACRHRKIRVLL